MDKKLTTGYVENGILHGTVDLREKAKIRATIIILLYSTQILTEWDSKRFNDCVTYIPTHFFFTKPYRIYRVFICVLHTVTINLIGMEYQQGVNEIRRPHSVTMHSLISLEIGLVRDAYSIA